MTRIVSGAWRGRRLIVPRDRHVRPTAERVREAWLNILGRELLDASIVDLFAGTGALGLEALSRGARHATFVESHAASLRVLTDNVAALDATAQVTVHRGDALEFARALPDLAFGVALADPPFDTDFDRRLVDAWRARPFANVLAVEHPRSRAFPDGETRRWGDIAVTFFRAP